MPPKHCQLHAPCPKASGNAFQDLVDPPHAGNNVSLDGGDERTDGSDDNTIVTVHPCDSGTATATPALRLQQPAPKASIFPSASDSQQSFTYLCKFPESSTLISLIFIAKAEFSRDFAYPTTRNAAQISPTLRPTPKSHWQCLPSSCGPSSLWKQPFL
jgi:hypothetical protein